MALLVSIQNAIGHTITAGCGQARVVFHAVSGGRAQSIDIAY